MTTAEFTVVIAMLATTPLHTPSRLCEERSDAANHARA